MTSWDRRLWGVVLMPAQEHHEATLLGSRWHDAGHVCYPGAATRPLSFKTRAAARVWVRSCADTYFGKRYQIVRIRETVDVVRERKETGR